MKNVIWLLLLSCLTTFAAETQKQPVKKNKGLIGDSIEKSSTAAYGMSGCGLGSVLFGESDSRGGQVLSSTTNGLYSNNTFGMTSGTSNCVQENSASTAALKKNMENFIAANRKALENDVAKSNGESLVALSSIMGCNDSTYLGTKLQAEYDSIFVNDKDAEIVDHVYNTASNDRYLTENCKL